MKFRDVIGGFALASALLVGRMAPCLAGEPGAIAAAVADSSRPARDRAGIMSNSGIRSRADRFILKSEKP